MTWRDELRQYLQENHLNEQEFARQCGISGASVSCYLRGTRNPGLGSAVQMARIMGKPADFFLERDPEAKKI